MLFQIKMIRKKEKPPVWRRIHVHVEAERSIKNAVVLFVEKDG